jgi:DMSO/TMAO reductase YedYZ molybdopterin-dependent catalytic subunit
VRAIALVLIALGSGLAHATGLVERVGPLTIMQVHVGAAVTALALAAAAAAALTVWEGALAASRLPGGRRRFTGSVEQGSGTPAAMPVVAWLDDRVQRIEPDAWRLRVGDGVYDLAAIEALPHESLSAALDCTGGWFSVQRWEGVRLDRLVDPGGDGWRSVEVRSATGYALRFPLRDLSRTWLVTRAGGAPLSAGHGFPARIVAPGRRGFWW